MYMNELLQLQGPTLPGPPVALFCWEGVEAF
jgi:hypothetical protein